MAEEDDSEKTEEPTQKKIDDAIKDGNVVRSPDVVTMFMLVAASVAVLGMGGGIAREIALPLRNILESAHTYSFDSGAMVQLFAAISLRVGLALAGVMALLSFAAVLGNLVQSKPVWSGKKLKPDIKKINPFEGIKRVFGPEALFGFVKNTVKMIIVMVCLWFAIEPHLHTFEMMPSLAIDALLPVALDVLSSLIIYALVAVGVVAGADYLLQRMQWMKRLKMTKEEVKNEMKDSEGDPHIKMRRRQIQMERSRSRMMSNVSKATVIVTNPTHYAVALRYVQGETLAPVCLAKGVDAVALRIREEAEKHDIPIVEEPPLARALFAGAELDKPIPPQLFEATAKIIGLVMRLAQERARRNR